MIPLKLTIEGSIGILAGLNREDLTMDLSELIPNEAITVAIKGDNGSGKSTLLNLAMTPWREPPMLTGTLYDEFGDTGLRVLEFSHGGLRYRSRIEIKQTPKTKICRAYLHVLRTQSDTNVHGAPIPPVNIPQRTPDNGVSWEPVTLPDHTASDGKTRTYDECLEYVLGPQSIYYLSAFRAQNTPALAEYDDPKRLMRDLLVLDEPQSLRERAQLIVRELRREYDRIGTWVDLIEQKSETLDGLSLQISAAEADIQALVMAKTDASEAAALVRAEFECATKADADNVKLRQQHDAVEKRLEATSFQHAQAVIQAEGDLNRAKTRLETERNAGLAIRQQINRRIESAQQMLQRRDEINQAAADADALAERVPDCESSINELRQKSLKVTELTGQLRTLQSNLNHNVSTGRDLAANLTDMTQRAGYVNQVPCGGKSPYDACPALKNALQANGLIPGIEADIKKKRLEWLDLHHNIATLDSEINGLGDTRDLSDLEVTLASIRLGIERLRQTAAMSSGIVEAERQLGEATMALGTAAADDSAKLIAIEAEIAELTERVAHARSDRIIAIRVIQDELHAVPLQDPADRLIVARRDMEAAVIMQTLADGAVDKQNACIAEMCARAAGIRSEIDAGQEMRDRAKYMSDEIAHWRLLSIALQGVIDLSIEDAGPAVSRTSNKLLTEAYGPRFSTKIITQREQANGRLVECFDIFVIDADTGVEASILKKSGGESVWLDKALTDSVGLFHQDSAGIHYECLFADESEDGLTQDRKARFYRMDRAALAMGGYKRKYFITHNPDAWSMADAVIDLGEFRQ